MFQPIDQASFRKHQTKHNTEPSQCRNERTSREEKPVKAFERHGKRTINKKCVYLQTRAVDSPTKNVTAD